MDPNDNSAIQRIIGRRRGRRGRWESMSRSRLRNLTAAVLIGTPAFFLITACTASESFTTPIEWGDGSRFELGNSQNQDIPATVRLLGGGKAVLAEFPQGESSTDAEGHVCFTPSSEDPYSGSATWKLVSPQRFELTFGGSRVEVSGGSSRFGDPNWSEVGFDECGNKGAQWGLYLTCGDPGGPDTGLVACRPDWP